MTPSSFTSDGSVYCIYEGDDGGADAGGVHGGRHGGMHGGIHGLMPEGASPDFGGSPDSGGSPDFGGSPDSGGSRDGGVTILNLFECRLLVLPALSHLTRLEELRLFGNQANTPFPPTLGSFDSRPSNPLEPPLTPFNPL